jgi:hypothetical protein
MAPKYYYWKIECNQPIQPTTHDPEPSEEVRERSEGLVKVFFCLFGSLYV